MDYEHFFVSIKQRVVNDFGDNFNPKVLDQLSLSLSYRKQSRRHVSDHYRSRAAKIPAYYNPNTHSVHLNIHVLERANSELVENIYYHELLHASSHHARTDYRGLKVLKSGLKIQTWNEQEDQVTMHRGLNEGLTQYLANCHSSGGGMAYRNEVMIIGKLIQRIGMRELKEAYFDASIDKLDNKISVVIGQEVFDQLSHLIDARRFDEAEALLAV